MIDVGLINSTMIVHPFSSYRHRSKLGLKKIKKDPFTHGAIFTDTKFETFIFPAKLQLFSERKVLHLKKYINNDKQIKVSCVLVLYDFVIAIYLNFAKCKRTFVRSLSHFSYEDSCRSLIKRAAESLALLLER